MSTTINYAVKFSSMVDEAFSLGSLTQGIINNDFDWIGVEAVKVFSIPTVDWDDYDHTAASNRYGNPTELGNEVQTMLVQQDKAFTFTIDRKSTDDTMGTMQAAQALSRQLEQVVIPGIDKYRIAKLVAGCPTANVVKAAVDKTNAYEEFLKVQEKLDEAKAPAGGRIALVTPAYLNKVKLDDAFTHEGDMATKISINGVVGSIDNVPVVKVPASYFPAGVDFVITNPMVMPAPSKLIDYKIHDNPVGINGYVVEGRFRFDAFTLKNKRAAIGVHAGASTTITPDNRDNVTAPTQTVIPNE